jgi:MYXO-CTERM domain-containing protein
LSRALAALLVTFAVVAPVAADSAGPLETVLIPREASHAAVGTLFLNRCVGGCRVIKSGLNDARTRASTIPQGPETEYTVSEFAWGDAQWAEIVTCMKEVYSPYKIEITDQQPPPGVPYNESIIAGRPSEIGRSGIGGIAPITGDCGAYNYTINYTFANNYGPNNRVFSLCAVAAQESGHSFGLDHTYAFADGTSGCRDPMTYRNDCGGQKFFRNETATCGEGAPRPCSCGANQNSHLKLLSVIGPGTPITAPPTLTVTAPAPNTTIAPNTTVLTTAFAQRGIKTVELWINGYLWKSARGAAFGASGQPESSYGLPIPAEVPDGVLDLVVKAKDDIDVTTTAPTITVTKGAPCASADSCAAGQQCDQGRCFWEPATGELGDACTYPQFCLSEICKGTASESRCTQACIPGVADSCPTDFDCLESGTNQGVCWPAGKEDGGICSTSGSSAPTQLGLIGIALVFGLTATRRRRRR